MAKKTITVCDECGTGGTVLPFVVEGDGRLARMDLCPEHAAPLLAILDTFARVKTSHTARDENPEPRRGGRYREMVTTMDDLDELLRNER